MKKELEEILHSVCFELFNLDISIELTRPDQNYGDFATNVALQIAPKIGKNPREIAESIALAVRESAQSVVSEVNIAGPGFINLRVHDSQLHASLHNVRAKSLQGKIIVVEYSDPNPFKVLHAGHLYTTIVGDSIARIIESAGATVHRLNYGGDVGLHVGKTMWAIVQQFGGENPDKLNDVPISTRPDWLSERYVEGTAAYEATDDARTEIISYNKRIYEIQAQNDHDSPLAQIYWQCRTWSYDGFKQLYDQLQVQKFDRYISESEVTDLGVSLVKRGLEERVYVLSNGAVVFNGEEYGLHTRVFINSDGLPTYEAKELGLAACKWQDYTFDASIIITGNDIVEYMKVVLQSLKHFYPEVVERTKHLTHGMIKLPGGEKMSSRRGNVLRAKDIIAAAEQANKELNGQDNPSTVLGAIKYAFLKNRIGGDIVYDPLQSVSLEGNSGPYLQYAHARARSIVAKMASKESSNTQTEKNITYEPDERSLASKISEFNEVYDKSVQELMPHFICTYLYELAQVFNHFYEHNRVIDDPRESTRAELLIKYADTLKTGLDLLGIAAPDRM